MSLMNVLVYHLRSFQATTQGTGTQQSLVISLNWGDWVQRVQRCVAAGSQFPHLENGLADTADPVTHRQKTWAHNSSSHHVSAPVHSRALFENVVLGLKGKYFPIIHLKHENDLSSHTTKLASTVIPWHHFLEPSSGCGRVPGSVQ